VLIQIQTGNIALSATIYRTPIQLMYLNIYVYSIRTGNIVTTLIFALISKFIFNTML
jgi:hypothetical protein